MSYPTQTINTDNLNAGDDSPALARADILDAVQKLNEIIQAYGIPLGICPLDGNGRIDTAHLINRVGVQQIINASITNPKIAADAIALENIINGAVGFSKLNCASSDTTMGGTNPSDIIIPTQAAVAQYVNNKTNDLNSTINNIGGTIVINYENIFYSTLKHIVAPSQVLCDPFLTVTRSSATYLTTYQNTSANNKVHVPPGFYYVTVEKTEEIYLAAWCNLNDSEETSGPSENTIFLNDAPVPYEATSGLDVHNGFYANISNLTLNVHAQSPNLYLRLTLRRMNEIV